MMLTQTTVEHRLVLMHKYRRGGGEGRGDRDEGDVDSFLDWAISKFKNREIQGASIAQRDGGIGIGGIKKISIAIVLTVSHY